MRSQLVYLAGKKIVNRFLLSTVAMRAVQRLHVVTTRTEDTANRVLGDIADGRFTDVRMPAIKPLASIEPVMVDLVMPAA